MPTYSARSAPTSSCGWRYEIRPRHDHVRFNQRGPRNRDRYNNPEIVRTEVAVPGCRFRPLPAKEKVDLSTNVVTDPWKATCPPDPAVVGTKPNDEIKVDGVTYQIVGGVRVFDDMGGRPYKVTVIAQQQVG
ncbi:phage head completion protein [Mycolicibacterium septicum]|uniref:phage head completion protein n=1 Tax=Mycolicibacterium septicum TaxID=98668 RepID=UPI003D337F6F